MDRLMRQEGMRRLVRGRKVRTTIPARNGQRARDLLNRQFRTSAPNRAWVTDFTYCPAWSGFACIAFAIDLLLGVRIRPPRPGLEQWDEIKLAASEAILALGGTITHNHAVRRDHRRWYLREMPPLFTDVLRGAKMELDPAGIMNPGVLMQPTGSATTP